MSVRRAAVAGSWYPASAAALTAAVETHLYAADQDSPRQPPPGADLVALIAPHAGLIYSGPVAAHAYRSLRNRRHDVAVLIGPSHHVGFEGVSVWRRGAFETPLGPLTIDHDTASRLIEACPLVHELPSAHGREHSLEMQLPFLAALTPDLPIVPLVMGQQTRETALTLGDCLAQVLEGRRALLVASSDLSHFFDASTAAFLDRQVIAHVEALDEEGLMTRLEERRDHACGGGPIVSVMRAAKALGATTSRVLRYANSGDVSGDTSSVVGYLAAAMWR
ncbi:MAG TPA: AmmeMemoRadiSam system protein B [Vicinamibacterales bacterium]|nr:AmmeMemoRadiSam system protein B [Vicinamibacterales bacterium]